MKMMKLVVLIAMIALTLFLILPNLSWAADDGAAISKQRALPAMARTWVENRRPRFPAWSPMTPRNLPMPT